MKQYQACMHSQDVITHLRLVEEERPKLWKIRRNQLKSKKLSFPTEEGEQDNEEQYEYESAEDEDYNEDEEEDYGSSFV